MSALTEAIEKAIKPKVEDWFDDVKQGNQGGISSLADAVKSLQEKMRDPEKQGSQSWTDTWTDTWTVPYEEDEYSFSPEEAQDKAKDALFGTIKTIFGNSPIPQSEENSEDNQPIPPQDLLQFNPNAEQVNTSYPTGNNLKSTVDKYVDDQEKVFLEKQEEKVEEAKKGDNTEEFLNFIVNTPEAQKAGQLGNAIADWFVNIPEVKKAGQLGDYITDQANSVAEGFKPVESTNRYNPEEHGFEQITDPNSIAMPSGIDLDKMSERERAEWQQSTELGLLATALIGGSFILGPGTLGAGMASLAPTISAEWAAAHPILTKAAPIIQWGAESALGNMGLYEMYKGFGSGALNPGGEEGRKGFYSKEHYENTPNEPLYEKGYTIEDNPYGFKTETQKMQFDKFFKNNDDFVKEHGWDRFGDDWHQRYTTFRVEAEPEDWQLAAQTIPGWRERFEEAGVNVDDIDDVRRWYNESMVDIDSLSQFDEKSLIDSASYADSAADLYDYMAYRNMGYPIYDSSGQLTVTPESNREAYGQAKIFYDEDFALDPVELNYLFRNAAKDPIEYGTGNEYADVDDYPLSIEDLFLIGNNGMIDTTSGVYGTNPSKTAGLINKRTEGKIKVKQKSKDKK